MISVTYHFVSFVPHFLPWSGFKALVDVQELVMEVLDGRLALFGIVGWRV